MLQRVTFYKKIRDMFCCIGESEEFNICTSINTEIMNPKLDTEQRWDDMVLDRMLDRKLCMNILLRRESLKGRSWSVSSC